MPSAAKQTKSPKPDERGLAAVETAREALLGQVPAGDVGEHLGGVTEAPKVTTHFFACVRPGYRGWRWSVTVARAPRQQEVTIGVRTMNSLARAPGRRAAQLAA